MLGGQAGLEVCFEVEEIRVGLLETVTFEQ